MLNHKGQSITEMAIFGTLIIMAFSFAIMFSERINRQQSYIMQAFRESLNSARTMKGSISYTKIADRRMPNVAAPMTLGNLETFYSSNNLLWCNLFTDLSTAHTYYKINDAPQIEVMQTLSIGVSGGGGSGAVLTPVVTNGAITGFNIISGGSGYTSAPTITITGGYGNGTGAAATAVVTDGVVTGVTMTSGGSGYIAPPTGPAAGSSTTLQTTTTENEQTLTKSPSADSVSSRTLNAQDTLVESSGDSTYTDYSNETFYLNSGGTYSVSGSGLSRSGSLTSAGR